MCVVETVTRIGTCCRDPNKNTDGSWIPSEGGAYWPIHSSTYREYLEISTTNITMGKGLRAKECAFWSHYLPQLLRKGNQLLMKFQLSIQH